MRMKVYRKEHTWLKARSKLITSSDIPVLCGVGYTDPRTLYHAKRGELVGEDKRDMAVRFAVGHALEPLVDKLTCEELGITTIDPGKRAIMQHQELDWAGATLDRMIVEKWHEDAAAIPKMVGVLETKTANDYVAHNWDDGPAKYALTQLLWQLEICELEYGVAAALLGLDRFIAYEVDLNDYRDLADEIMDRAWAFHRRLITGDPPPATAASIPALKLMYPKQEAAKLHIIPPAAGWPEKVSSYSELKARKKELNAELRAVDSEMKDFEAVIMSEMEDAEISTGPGFRATWKQQTRKATAESQFRVLRIKIEEE